MTIFRTWIHLWIWIHSIRGFKFQSGVEWGFDLNQEYNVSFNQICESPLFLILYFCLFIIKNLLNQRLINSNCFNNNNYQVYTHTSAARVTFSILKMKDRSLSLLLMLALFFSKRVTYSSLESWILLSFYVNWFFFERPRSS